MSTNSERQNSPESVEMSDLIDRALRELSLSGNAHATARAERERVHVAESPLPTADSNVSAAGEHDSVATNHPAVAAHDVPTAAGGRSAAEREQRVSSAELPPVLRHAYDEISSMLHTLRSSRDALEQATTEQLHHTSAKLEEVTSATEVAATGLLDGLDRALNMVDELDELDGSGDERATVTRTRLRDELFQSITYLQFQDITTQQLNYASSILQDMEQRLAEIVGGFDPSSVEIPDPACELSASSTRPVFEAFDPDASLCDAERRQALVDEILMRMD